MPRVLEGDAVLLVLVLLVFLASYIVGTLCGKRCARTQSEWMRGREGRCWSRNVQRQQEELVPILKIGL